MNNSLLKSFFSKGKIVKFAKNEEIVNPNRKIEGVYYIKKGFIVVYSLENKTKEIDHAIYKEGEIFPLLWALKGTKKGHFAKAYIDTTVFQISRTDFLNFIKDNPKILWEVIDHLATNTNIFVERLMNLELSKASTKVASRLVFFANRFGKKLDNEILLDIPITHADIAGSLALSRETTSRELKKFENRGIIETKERRIVIKDLAKLLNILGVISGFIFYDFEV